MQKKSIKKLYYLLISLESLNLKFSEEHTIDNINSFKNNKILCTYITKINLTAMLYQIIKKNQISKFIQLIFKKKQLLNRYINKFYKIYSSQNYYVSYTSHKKLEIRDLSIINLYIIYRIIKSSSLRYLIYYLLT